MSQIVLEKSMREIEKMKEFYQAFVTEKTPPGGIFATKTTNCMITAYRSGKVLFQGAGCKEEAAKWGNPEEAMAQKQQTATKRDSNSELPAGISRLSCIGSDEVGTGDFFGPITVCAAYVRKEDIPLLQEFGVQDSKNLTDDKISAIARRIIPVIPYNLLLLPNEKYNKIQQTGMSQGKIKALLHNQAIGHLLKKIAPEKPEVILIDQFAKKETYYSYLKGQKTIYRENVYFSTKAEGVHLAVAAASIIARYAFIRQFEKLSKEAGFPLPKGAGAQVDTACARLIKEKGKEVLPSFVKLHFANTEKAFDIVRRAKD